MPHHHHKHAYQTPSDSDATTPGATAGVAPGDQDQDSQLVSAEDVRLRAYGKWESAGKPAGDGLQFWLEAEQELARGT